MSKSLIIILFVIIWGIIWLPCAIYEGMTEDERLDKLYEKLEKRQPNKQ